MLSTLTVVNNLDSGPGSLRAEIAAAQNGDTIVFDPSLNGQTIALTSGELSISTGLTIQGPGAAELAVKGGSVSRAFEVNASQPVVLSGLAISGQGAPYAIDNHTVLSISDCSISASHGGILNSVKLTVSGSSLSGNSAVGTAPSGGGIDNTGSAVLSNDTFSSDTAAYDGGGVYNRGTLSASGCTFDHDSAMIDGGGVDNASYAIATLTNGTLADNTAIANQSPAGTNLPGGGGFYADFYSHSILTNYDGP